MDIRLLIPELFEKLSLIATAGLLGVLVPPLRNRLLGVGRPRDIAVVVIFGLMFSLWGSTMGFHWLGHFLNLRAIGIMIAGILGGPRAGALTGILGGGFYVMRVVPEEFPWALAASVLDGWLAGRMSVRREQMFIGWRVLGAAALVQLAGLTVTSAGMAFAGSNPIEALPSLAAQLGGVAVGVALFVNVALVVISRQEQAVALVEAQAAANALSLTALRSRLEPHFLFNTLNTLRATIRRDPEQARTLVSDLADLYRYLLHHPHDASVMNEVDHACAYLAIEKARLGDERLAVQTSIDDKRARHPGARVVAPTDRRKRGQTRHHAEARTWENHNSGIGPRRAAADRSPGRSGRTTSGIAHEGVGHGATNPTEAARPSIRWTGQPPAFFAGTRYSRDRGVAETR